MTGINKHLLHILPRLPAPPNDGGAVYVYNTLKRLRELGHKITIVSLISNKHEQDKSAIEEIGDLYAADGKYKPYTLLPVLKSTLTRQPITIQHRMRKDIVAGLLDKVTTKPDVILLEGLHASAFIDEAKNRFPGVPVVLRSVNVEYKLLYKNGALSKNPFIKVFYRDQARLMKSFELNALQKADFITSISSRDIEQFKTDLPDASIFLSTAGADTKENPSLVRETGTILAVSNWRWKPNLDGLRWFLSEVWPSVIQNYPDVRLKVAGEGLSESFKNNYHSKNVEFLGFVDDIDTLRLTSSIFVAPLLSGSGMKLKVLEALAAGLPTVTTDFGAQGIDMADGIHYLHADTSNQFIHALNTLIENDQLRKELSVKGRKQIRDNYSWEKKVRELSSFLNSIS